MTKEAGSHVIGTDHATAIGYVASFWSVVEANQDYVIQVLLGLPSLTASAITAEYSTPQRLNLIKALLDLSGNDDWIAEWAILERKIDALRIRRNEAVHSSWELIGDEYFGTKIKSRGKVQVSVTHVHTNEIWELASRLMDITRPIIEFGDKLAAGGAAKQLKMQNPPGSRPHKLIRSKIVDDKRPPKANRKAPPKRG